MLTRIKQRIDADEGLTLVEMLVAIFVVGFALIAMSSTLITSFAGVVRNETLVHATSVANEFLEDLQALPWNSLALTADDVDAVGVGGQFEGEDLVVADDPDDPLLPSARPADVEAVERGWRDFDVELYITWAADSDVDDAHKRMTVIVSWEDRGAPRSMRVQGIRTPTPDEEALAGLELYLISVEPAGGYAIVDDDCYPDDAGADCGKYPSTITVTAVATQPVGNVELSYLQRSAITPTTVYMSYFPDRQVWERTIPAGRKFINGETLFTVTTTGDDGEIVDDVQRVVFLHPLEVARFEADREFCVNETGELQEPVTVTIDLIGADPTLRGDGLPLFWANDPAEAEAPDADALHIDGGETNWGGVFEFTFSPDDEVMPPVWDGEGAAPATVEVTVGPMVSALDDEPLSVTEEVPLTQVAGGESC